MKNLSTLIKLQKTKVDEQRILLLKLQQKLDAIIATLEAIEREKDEQEALLHEDPSLGVTYGDYLSRFLETKEILEKEKASTEHAVDIARDQLAELFEEQKRYEIAKQKRLDDITREEQRKDRIELDEIGSISFVRGKKERETR